MKHKNLLIIIFMTLILVSSVSATGDVVYDTHGSTLNTYSGEQIERRGVLVSFFDDGYINAVAKSPNINATRALIYDHSSGDFISYANFSGDIANFTSPVFISKDVDYRLYVDGNGGSYSAYQNISFSSVDSDHVSWKGSVVQSGFVYDDRLYDVVGIYSTIISNEPTFSFRAVDSINSSQITLIDFINDFSFPFTCSDDKDFSLATFDYDGGFASFRGTNSVYGKIPHSSDLNFTNKNFSFSIDLFREQDADTQRPLVKRGGGNLGFILQTGSADGIRFFAGNDSSLVNADTSHINLNTWYNVIGVYNGTHITIYIDGILKDTTPLTNYQSDDADLFIGYGSSAFWKGNLDNVALWDVALSLSDVQSVNISGPSAVSDGRVFFKDFNTISSNSSWVNVTPTTNNGELKNGIIINESGIIFDGVDDYISFDSGLDLNNDVSQSLVARVRLNEDGFNGFASQVVMNAEWVRMYFRDTTNRLIIRYDSGGARESTYTFGSGYREYINIVGIYYNNGTTELFVDGVSVDKDYHGVQPLVSYSNYIGQLSGTYFNGSGEYYAYYNRALTPSEILLINSSSPSVVSSGRVGYWDNTQYNSTHVFDKNYFGNYHYDITYPSGTYYNTTNNIALELMNSSSRTFTTTATPRPTITIRAYDGWDNSTINNFYARISNGTQTNYYSTTTGSINVTASNGTYNINVTYPNYFNNTEFSTTIDDSSDYSIIAYPNQTSIAFIPALAVTKQLRFNATVTASDGVNEETLGANTPFGLKAGDYNITFSLTDFNNLTVPYTATALESTTNITYGLYQSVLNITADNILNGTNLTSYEGWIYYLGLPYYNQTFNASNNLINLINTNYTIHINSEGYVPSTENYSITGDENKTISLHPDRSLYIYVRDTLTNDVLTNVSVVLYGEGITYNYTISDYNYSEYLEAGTYDLVATKSGYGTFTTQVVITENAYTNVTAYLSNLTSSQQTVFYVANEFQQYLTDALVTITRQYDGAIIGSQLTDLSGATEFYLANNINYYVNVDKIGYNSYVNETLYPIENTYTITLSFNTSSETEYYLGFTYDFQPDNNLLQNNTLTNFSFSYNATEWDADSLTMTLYDQDGNTINTTTITPTSGGDQTYLYANTSNYTKIESEILITIGSDTIRLTKGYGIKYHYQGRFSLMKLFDDLKDFSSSGFGQFGRLIISFIAIAGITMMVTSKTDFFGETERVLMLIWGLTTIFSVGGLLTINIGINSWVQQYGISLIIGLFAIIGSLMSAFGVNK